MVGGNYRTWFKEDGAKERSLLYKLENLGVLRLQSESGEVKNEIKHYEYIWILTKKGQELVNKYESLEEIWADGKIVNVVEFYNKIMEILDKEKD